MYFLMILRSELDTTLLVMIEKPLLLAQMKSAMTSNLISLSALLIFAMCLLNKTMILIVLSKLISYASLPIWKLHLHSDIVS